MPFILICAGYLLWLLVWFTRSPAVMFLFSTLSSVNYTENSTEQKKKPQTSQRLCSISAGVRATSQAMSRFFPHLNNRLTQWFHRINTVHKVSFPHVDSNLKEERKSWNTTSRKHHPLMLNAPQFVQFVCSNLLNDRGLQWPWSESRHLQLRWDIAQLINPSRHHNRSDIWSSWRTNECRKYMWAGWRDSHTLDRS